MSRRPATVTQADVRRVIAAAKLAGAAEVEIRLGDQAVVIVRFTATAPAAEEPLPVRRPIVL